MKISSLKTFNLEEFKSFWGYPGIEITSKQRIFFFNHLKLSKLARDLAIGLFEKNKWQSLLYTGKWEQTISKMSRLNRLIIGKRALQLFDQFTLAEQEYYLRNKFPKKAWSLAVFLLGNAKAFNALLYKSNFPKKNINNSYYRFYLTALERLFRQDLARNNFLLQLLFFGKLKFGNGLPLECNESIFHQAKKGLDNTQVSYLHGDVIEEAKNSKLKIDFLSLSDVPSYFKATRDQTFLHEVKKNISPGGLVVNRYYLKIPENIDSGNYTNITNEFSELIQSEKTQMYFYGVYKKNNL